MRTFETYTLPSHWASYFVNADASGYSDSELNEMDDFVNQNQKTGCDFYCVSVGEDHWFAWRNDANNLGADVCEFTFDISPVN